MKTQIEKESNITLIYTLFYQACDFEQWIDESALPTFPMPESHQDYQARLQEEESVRRARLRHAEEDLLWRNRLREDECNLRTRAHELDVREAHLRRRERICDRREADLHATRVRGRGTQ